MGTSPGSGPGGYGEVGAGLQGEVGAGGRKGGVGHRSLPLERFNVGVQRLSLVLPRSEQNEYEMELIDRLQEFGAENELVSTDCGAINIQ